MIKKISSLFLLFTISMASISSVSALDLEEIGNDTAASATATTTTPATTTTWTETKAVKISNMEVIFNDTKLAADWKSTTTMYIRVNDNNENSISDADIDLQVNINSNENWDKWSVWTIAYDKESQLFNATYTAWKTAWSVSFKVIATSKADSTVKLEQWEDFTLEAFVEPVATPVVETAVTPTNNVDSIINTLETTETASTDTTKATETATTESVNIVETKVIDENRLKVTFDKEVFLPDEPLSLVKLTKNSDGSEVKISNITLSEDKMSFIVLTADSIKEEPYKLTITEVINGETKKKMSVINSELTVTWMNEIMVVILWLLLISWVIAYRRKNV